MSIHQKLVEISKDMGFIEFDAKNTGQGYKYASAAGILRTLQKSLQKHGVTRRCTNVRMEFIPGPDNKSNLCQIVAEYTWTDAETGESLRGMGEGGGKDSGDKAPMKASTAANKYEIAHTLCLGWGAEDPDASDPETGKSAKSSSKKTPAAIKKAIDSAKDMASLEKTRGAITTAPVKDQEKLKEAYKAKKEQLS